MISNTNSPSWTVHSNHDIFKRMEFACGTHQDRYIVVAGGIRGWRHLLQSAVMYDITTQSIIRLPDLPHPGKCCGVVLKEFFYVATYSVQIYRICLVQRREWEEVQNGMKDIIVDMITDGNHLYLFGSINRMYRYNPNKDELVKLTSKSMYSRHHDFTTAVIDHQLYVIGGGNILENDTVEIFDLNTHVWTHGVSLPKPIVFPVACVIENKWIVVTGGRAHDVVIFVYDLQTQQWTENESLLSHYRVEHSHLKVGTQMVSVGGSDININFCPIETIHVKHLISDWCWERIKDLILLRELVDQNRAHPIKLLTTNVKCDLYSSIDSNAVLRKVIVDVSLDVFRHVISFII